jgi:hypothetical protein
MVNRKIDVQNTRHSKYQRSCSPMAVMRRRYINHALKKENTIQSAISHPMAPPMLFYRGGSYPISTSFQFFVQDQYGLETLLFRAFVVCIDLLG